MLVFKMMVLPVSGLGGLDTSSLRVDGGAGGYPPNLKLLIRSIASSSSQALIDQSYLIDDVRLARTKIHRDPGIAPQTQGPNDDFTLDLRTASRTALERERLIVR